jgi:hypothetical protein
VIAKMAGLNVPQGTRCLMADVGGVGREHPLSMEKLSPILAFYVEDGVERGAARCFEILSYGGMGHTAGIHTRSRDIAKAYGMEMPASRVVVNTPTTHGAIGFSTALPPSMTLGCGSWGGNVTSDNISPLHLMDIKRVAFETRPVKSARPAQSSTQASTQTSAPASQAAASVAPQTSGKVSREDVAAIVDRFLSNRNASQPTPTYNTPMRATDAPTPTQPVIDVEVNRATGGSAAPHADAAPNAQASGGSGNGGSGSGGANAPSSPAPKPAATASGGGGNAQAQNGHKAVDFVSEDDVRRAIQKGEKIYVNAKTIITPSARDIGDPAEVFAKV